MRLARDAARRDAEGLREPLPAPNPGAFREAPRATARPGGARGERRRPRLPLRVRTPRAGRAQPERRRPAGTGTRPGTLLRGAPASAQPGRRTAKPGAPRPRPGARPAYRRDRERARARSRPACSSRTCSSRSRAARRSRAASRTGEETTSARSSAPAEVAARWPDDRDALRATVELAERLEFDLTEELGYALSRLLGRARPGRRAAPPRLRGRVRRALPEEEPEGGGAPAGRARADRGARPLRLLPPALGGARAGPRGRRRGARPRLTAASASSRARARQLGRVDRLLPHRPLARGSRRDRPEAGAVPEPRARLGARHRPRLPAGTSARS